MALVLPVRVRPTLVGSTTGNTPQLQQVIDGVAMQQASDVRSPQPLEKSMRDLKSTPPPASAEAVKSAPILLGDEALKQVSGGVIGGPVTWLVVPGGPVTW